MRILKQCGLIAAAFVIICRGMMFGQVLGDYQSAGAGPGNWGDPATWQTYDGFTWNAAGTPPAATSGQTITIQTGHTVIVAASVTISSGCNVVVNGYLKATVGGITASTSPPLSFTFNDGSTYEHAMAGGSIPMSTWNTGSTCVITGSTGASPGNGIQNFYNFTWNCPSQSTGLNLAWDNVTIGGNLTVTASGTSAGQQFRMTSAATTRTITINGDVIVNGGYLTASGSSGAAQYNITVKGNINVQSGKFNLCGGSGGFGTWRLWGNLTIGAAGQFVVGSNKTINTILIFAGGGAQSYTLTSGGTNANLSYGVENGSVVTLNSPLTVGNSTAGNGGLVMTNGKFITTATNLMTLASAASVTTGSGFVVGPLAETVAATSGTLTFPVGGTVYRPVVLTLTQDASTSTTYTAEIKETTVPTNTLPSTLDAVSTVRYLHLVKGAGANVNTATIQLSYDTNDGVDVSNKDMIRIAKDDGGGNWINLGTSGTANNTGTILSNAFGASTSLGTLTTNDYVIAHVNPASIASLATLTVNTVSAISTTFATSGGVISNDGNAAISTKGVCWNTGGTPTTADSYTSDGATSTPFTSSVTGLIPGTLYYIRAYATNSAGTAYSTNELTFTTLSTLDVPTLTTTAVSSIVNTSASSGGTISAWGGSSITDRGVCWSTSHNPTVANDFNSAGAGGEGIFITPIGGLQYGQTYYVRAYATNSTGTGYGDEVSFSSPVAQPDVYKIVDKNGAIGVNCDYKTVQAAFDAVTPNYTGRWTIYVRNGTYYEKTWLLSTKINVILVGESKENTILTFDDYAGKNTTTVFAGGTIVSNGTNTSFTCAIDPPDFEAQNITFQNTANAYAPGSPATQAVALRANGDRQKYYNCNMKGYQDTYYTQGGLTGPDRLYHKNCYIEGAVDFIFGRDVALFDSCTIYCNRNGGVVTAGATEAGYSYGYVFLNCTLGSPAAGVKGCDSVAMVSFYLGRPWQSAPKTVYLFCDEPATVNAAGWTTMGPNPALYAEYNCSGPGYVAGRPGLSAWGGTQPTTITADQAATYTIANIFSKNNKGGGFTYAANWIPSMSNVKFPMPILSGLPSNVDMGIMGITISKIDSVTVTNTGNTDLSISSIISTDSRFVVSPTSAIVSMAGSQKFYITFTPDTLKAFIAKLIFMNNSVQWADTVTLSGTGVNAATFSVTSSTHDFGNVKISTSKKDSIAITNNGGDSLRITNIVSTDTRFVVGQGSMKIAPAETKKVPVTFTPDSLKLLSASIIFTDNTTNGKDTLTVRGLGVKPLFGVSSFAIDEGRVTVGAAKNDSFYVYNRGTGSLHLDSIIHRTKVFTIIAAGAGPYIITPIDSQKIYVTFAPTVLGVVIDTVIVFNDGMKGQDTLYISGLGVQSNFVASPLTLNFGSVTAKTTKRDSILVTNSGRGLLVIDSITVDNILFTVTASQKTIDSSSSAKFYVTFSPTITATSIGHIIFYHNAQTKRDTIKVTGFGMLLLTIKQARADTNGTEVMFNGIVTKAKGSYTYMQDDSAGIVVYQDAAGIWRDSVAAGVIKPGAQIQVHGRTSEYNQLKEIGNGDILGYKILSTKNKIPTPKIVSLKAIADSGEYFESQLVNITGMTIVSNSDATFLAAKNYSIVDASDSTYAVVLRIPNASDSDVDGRPMLKKVDFTGVVGQFHSTNPLAGYQLMAIDTVDLKEIIVGAVKMDLGIPKMYVLDNNYPNPFNPSTTIQYGLPVASSVVVKIYSILGQEIATLVNGVQEAGYHRMTWRADHCASGLYFLRVTARSLGNTSNNFTQVKKMLLMK